MIGNATDLRLGFAALCVCLLAGCRSADDNGQHILPAREPAAPAVRTHHITAGTVLRLDDGWEVGLEMIYRGRYTAVTGQARTGLLARISVWDGQAPQAEMLVVHEGSEFTAGGRYRVVALQHPRLSHRIPGSGRDSMVIEQMLAQP